MIFTSCRAIVLEMRTRKTNLLHCSFTRLWRQEILTWPNDAHYNNICDFELCPEKYKDKCVYCSGIFTHGATRTGRCVMLWCVCCMFVQCARENFSLTFLARSSRNYAYSCEVDSLQPRLDEKQQGVNGWSEQVHLTGEELSCRCLVNIPLISVCSFISRDASGHTHKAAPVSFIDPAYPQTRATALGEQITRDASVWIRAKAAQWWSPAVFTEARRRGTFCWPPAGG